MEKVDPKIVLTGNISFKSIYEFICILKMYELLTLKKMLIFKFYKVKLAVSYAQDIAEHPLNNSL